jgi:hypothetical protein
VPNSDRSEIDREELFELIRKAAAAPLPVAYADVPKETREWLNALRPEDLAEISEAVRFMRSARVVGRFGRWALITFVTVFGGAVTFGDKLMTMWKNLGGVQK